jgi:hypothetical protein
MMPNNIYKRRLMAMSVRVANEYLKAPSVDRVAKSWVESNESMTLVAVVKNGEFVRVSEDTAKVSSDMCAPGSSLYYLRQVPLDVAEKLVDHSQPGGFNFSSGKEAWSVAKGYADSQPFKSF